MHDATKVLTGRTMTSERAAQLLALANYQKVATVLGVSRASVARWAKGEITPWQLQRLEDLMENRVHKETPTPEWAQGLISDVSVIRQVVESNADQLAILRALLEARQSGLLQSADDPVDDPAPPQTAGKHGR